MIYDVILNDLSTNDLTILDFDENILTVFYLPLLSFRFDGSRDEFEAVRRLLMEQFPA